MSQYQPIYDSFNRNIPDRYVPSARMSVSASVYLPGSEIDLTTGQLKPDRQRRRRTQSKRLERERLEREQKRLEESVRRERSKGGVRVSVRAGLLMIAALISVRGLVILSNQGKIVERQKEINRLERAVAECRSQNADLETRIAEASDVDNICYAASRNLNMIPSEAAEAIHLVAVDTRPQKTQPVHETQPVMVQTTASLEVQATHVPAIASN